MLPVFLSSLYLFCVFFEMRICGQISSASPRGLQHTAHTHKRKMSSDNKKGKYVRPEVRGPSSRRALSALASVCARFGQLPTVNKQEAKNMDWLLLKISFSRNDNRLSNVHDKKAGKKGSTDGLTSV